MPKRRTSISVGGGLLLALTLTLSACPKPDAAEPSDADSTQVAPIAAPEASTRAACPGPAPAPFDSLKVGNPNQPWSVVTGYVAANPLDTQAAKPGKVKLCAKCAEIEATITPLRNACAISPDSTSPQTWLLGTVKASQQPTDTANIQMFGQGNDSSIVYLLQSDGQTYALYPKGGQTAYVGGIQGGKRWSFSHCNDTTTHGKAAWGKYDPTKPVCQGRTPTGNSHGLGTTDPLAELSYGWMACISGCCRFYGSQPGNPPPTEEVVTGPPPGTPPGPPPGPPPGRP